MLARVLVPILAAALLALPQESELALTNENVASMLKAGLAESTIVNAIELAAARGTVRFDTSPEALIALKEQGATAPVLDAMLLAEARPKRVLPSTTIPGLPTTRGVYHQQGTRWLELPSVTVFPEIQTSWRRMSAIEHRVYVLAGAGAGLRLQETRPSFYVRGIDPQRGWRLVRLSVKGEHRMWRTGPSDVFRFARAPERERGGPEIEFRAVAHDVFEVRPLAALEPGEYALAATAPGQRWLVEAYEFAVR